MLIHPFFIYFYCFNFISLLRSLSANKRHAIKKYSLEDMKKQTSWLFTLLAMILLFSTPISPSLKLAFYDSFLSTGELLMDTGMVPPCNVIRQTSDKTMTLCSLTISLAVCFSLSRGYLGYLKNSILQVYRLPDG